MTTINSTDDWLDQVRAWPGARSELVSRLEPSIPAGYDELNDPADRGARLRQRRRLGDRDR